MHFSNRQGREESSCNAKVSWRFCQVLGEPGTLAVKT